MPKVRRYPGVRSFEDDPHERPLFRGRETEAYDLLQLVRGERLVVLFARSGIGKSSLINAGLMEPLREQGFFPIVARVASVRGDPVDSLYAGVRTACERAEERGEIAQCEPSDPAEWDRTSFWHFFKSFYIWRGEAELLRPVVIIDQFEELFTLLSAEQRRPFIDQLANLVRGIRPEESLGDARGDASVHDDSPPDVRIVIAIREDFMANLEEMAERIPSILKARFRLGPLDVEQARRAIVEPAEVTDSEMETPPFSWSPEALSHVLDFLRMRKRSDGTAETGHEVEPFQLQLVCQFAEALVREKHLTTIRDGDLGGDAGLSRILTRFYQTVLDAVCHRFSGRGLRRRLMDLCEYGLITPKGRRLLAEESTIRMDYGISAEILGELVERRLVRKERRLGDNYYELTHDTLIDPILASRERREGKKRRLRVGVAGALGLVLLVGAGLAVQARRALQERVDQGVAAQLIENGQAWVERQQFRLAAAFFQAAIARDARADTLPATADSVEAEFRVPRDSVHAVEADSSATNAIAEARKSFADIRGEALSPEQRRQNSRETLTLISGVIGDLVTAGNALAARLYVPDAERVYGVAKELEDNSARTFGQTGPGRRDVARREQLRIAELLARAAYAAEALQMLDSVQARYGENSVTVDSWNAVCWSGALWGDPAEVRAACERAVAEADSQSIGAVRDSRGVVLARMGEDLDLAADDFVKYAEWGPRHFRSSAQIEKRQAWVSALQEGRNPFRTGATLDTPLGALRDEEERSVQEARKELADVYHPMTQEGAEESVVLLMTEWVLDPPVLHYLRNAKAPLCELTGSDPEPGCDERWEDTTLVGMQAIESNPCSAKLKALVARESILSEIFVTDSVGFNVCMSNLTSDYFQADERWWIAARSWIPGATIGRSTVNFDRSAGELAYAVYGAVRDPDSGAFLGVIKGVFDADVRVAR